MNKLVEEDVSNEKKTEGQNRQLINENAKLTGEQMKQCPTSQRNQRKHKWKYLKYHFLSVEDFALNGSQCW